MGHLRNVDRLSGLWPFFCPELVQVIFCRVLPLHFLFILQHRGKLSLRHCRDLPFSKYLSSKKLIIFGFS